MNNELLLQRQEELQKFFDLRKEYADNIESKGVSMPSKASSKVGEEKDIESVVSAMKDTETQQVKLIEFFKTINEKEQMHVNPTAKKKKTLNDLEMAFLSSHKEFESLYNKAHFNAYYNVQKRASMVAKKNRNYEMPKYNRDRLDNKISNLAVEKGVCTENECFAQTMQNTRYVKGDFGTRYLDGKLFLSEGEKENFSEPLSNLEMLAVAIRDVVSDNKNVFTASREPKSKIEQDLINMRVKTAIDTDNEDMAMFYEEMRIEKALAEQELAMLNAKIDLSKIAETAFRLQLDIINVRSDREILQNCGKDIDKKTIKTFNRNVDELEKCFKSIDQKLDKILTFNKMDKEDYWQQVSMLGEKRFKDSFGSNLAPSVAEESFYETIEKAKGKVEVKSFENDYVAEEDGASQSNEYRVKTDIVKQALAQEKAKQATRELTPDPMSKQKSLTKSAPSLGGGSVAVGQIGDEQEEEN